MISLIISLVLFLISIVVRLYITYLQLHLKALEITAKGVLKVAEKGITERGTGRLIGKAKDLAIFGIILAIKISLAVAKLLIQIIRLLIWVFTTFGIVSSLISIFLIIVFVSAGAYILLGSGGSGSVILDTNSSTAITSGASTDTLNAGGILPPASGNLGEMLENLGKLYIANVPTYQTNPASRPKENWVYGTRDYYTVSFNGGTIKIGDDCTGFSGAYMRYVAGVTTAEIPDNGSGGLVHDDGVRAALEKHGWKKYSLMDEQEFANESDISKLQTGDILVINRPSSNPKYPHHHAEVYIDPNNSFGWGYIRTKYNTSNTFKVVKGKGLQERDDDTRCYQYYYRYVGVKK